MIYRAWKEQQNIDEHVAEENKLNNKLKSVLEGII